MVDHSNLKKNKNKTNRFIRFTRFVFSFTQTSVQRVETNEIIERKEEKTATSTFYDVLIDFMRGFFDNIL